LSFERREGKRSKSSATPAVFRTHATVVKVVPDVHIHFFTCSSWAVFHSHSTDGRAIGAGKEAF
jgi:hypothetical protein